MRLRAGPLVSIHRTFDGKREWAPEAVASGPQRRARHGDEPLRLEFALEREGGLFFAVHIEDAVVSRNHGRLETADLLVRLDMKSWRALNRGELSGPEAFLQRRVHLEGNLLLAVKLHLILG